MKSYTNKVFLYINRFTCLSDNHAYVRVLSASHVQRHSREDHADNALTICQHFGPAADLGQRKFRRQLDDSTSEVDVAPARQRHQLARGVQVEPRRFVAHEEK